MATWVDTIPPLLAAFPNTVVNRTAAGWLLFGKDVAEFARYHGKSIPFRWYEPALSALGYRKLGDQFDMSYGWEAMPYRLPGKTAEESTNDLLGQVFALSNELDLQGVPFIGVPQDLGSSKRYQKLAGAAWQTMRTNFPDVARASIEASRRRIPRGRADTVSNISGYGGRGTYGTFVGVTARTPQGWQEELQRVNHDIAEFSAMLTNAVNAKGYLAHDPMIATTETLVQDELARAESTARRGGKPLPPDPYVDYFKTGTWANFVLHWRQFYDANNGWFNESAERGPRIEHYDQQLAKKVAWFHRPYDVATPHDLPPATTPPMAAPRSDPRVTMPPSAPWTPPSEAPAEKTDVRKYVEYGLLGALALGGIYVISTIGSRR